MQVIRKQGKQPIASGKSEVKQLTPNDEVEDDPSIWTITGRHTEGCHAHLKVDKKPIKMELDTGAAVSVVSEQTIKIDWAELHLIQKGPMQLPVHASSYGLGAILSHVFEDGEHPVAFAS